MPAIAAENCDIFVIAFQIQRKTEVFRGETIQKSCDVDEKNGSTIPAATRRGPTPAGVAGRTANARTRLNLTVPFKVFIGWDSREVIAYDVAKRSLQKHASGDVGIEPIKINELIDVGIYKRPIDPLASTEFTYTRFFTPYLAGYEGWALFCDCDFLFFDDILKLQKFQDPAKAVLCVKHMYNPQETTKMDGKRQTAYPRKNWSSFMLFNCSHPASRQLTPDTINTQSPAYLHRMLWAADDEIGELPEEWNWLEGWNKRPQTGYPAGVHYTRGGPWFKEWQEVEYADEWSEVAREVDPEYSIGK